MVYIVHPESFRSNAQNAAETAHASIAVVSLRAFICVRLRVLFAIECVFACVRACNRSYVRAIVRTCMRSCVRDLHLKHIK